MWTKPQRIGTSLLALFLLLLLALVILLPIISLPILSTARSFAGPLSHRLADNPVAVELVAQTGGVTNAVAVQGNYAYAGVGPRLIVLDTSDRESD